MEGEKPVDVLKIDRQEPSNGEVSDLELAKPDSKKLKLSENLNKTGMKFDREALFRAPKQTSSLSTMLSRVVFGRKAQKPALP